MTDTMADRRGADRYPLVLLAEVTELMSGTRLSARTSDISRTGCFVDTLQPVPKGTAVYITLTQQSAVLKLKATVAYVSAGSALVSTSKIRRNPSR
jgi:hypothetical protein